jgi:hypothetical protein
MGLLKMADCRNCKYQDLDVNTNPCKRCKRCKLGTNGRSEWKAVKNIEIGFLSKDSWSRLMDDQVSYCLGDMAQELRPDERLERLLDIIECLCESHNQLEHLTSLGELSNVRYLWGGRRMINVHGKEATDILGRKIELEDLVLIKGRAGEGFKIGIAREKSIKFIQGYTGYNTSIYA